MTFAPERELINVYAQTCTLLRGARQPKQAFFSYGTTKVCGTEAEYVVAENRIVHLGEGAEVLYGFRWSNEEEGDGAQ